MKYKQDKTMKYKQQRTLKYNDHPHGQNQQEKMSKIFRKRLSMKQKKKR